ncbi:TPA: hypothetical protein ACT9MX_002514, partial [Legionella pneumophila]
EFNVISANFPIIFNSYYDKLDKPKRIKTYITGNANDEEILEKITDLYLSTYEKHISSVRDATTIIQHR